MKNSLYAFFLENLYGEKYLYTSLGKISLHDHLKLFGNILSYNPSGKYDVPVKRSDFYGFVKNKNIMCKNSNVSYVIKFCHIAAFSMAVTCEMQFLLVWSYLCCSEQIFASYLFSQSQ